jgi:hypothetical protein
MERIQMQNERVKKSDHRKGQQEVHAEENHLSIKHHDTTNNVFSVRDMPRQVKGVNGNHEERENEGNTKSSKIPRKQPKIKSDVFFLWTSANIKHLSYNQR